MEVMNSQALAVGMGGSKSVEGRRLRLSQGRPRLCYGSTFVILARVTVAINVGLVVPVRDLSGSAGRKTALNQAIPNRWELIGGKPVRLLVVEDEDRLSGILKSKLGDVGFTVDIAGSAADADAQACLRSAPTYWGDRKST